MNASRMATTVLLTLAAIGVHSETTIANFNAADWSMRAYYWGDQNADKPTVSSDGLTLNLANNVNNRAYVAWYRIKQNTGDFAVSFKINGGTGDGLLFVLQKGSNTNPTTAIGGAGGNWALKPADGAAGVKNAYGIQFWASALEQGITDNSAALTKSGYASGYAGVRGYPITLTWVDETNVLTVKGGSGAGFTKTYTYDLNAKLGNDFYFGFVASNGGNKGAATITDFSFTNGPKHSPATVLLLH